MRPIPTSSPVTSASLLLFSLLAIPACGPVLIGAGAAAGGGGGGSSTQTRSLLIVGNPPACTNQTTSEFRYARSPADAECEYQVDGGGWNPASTDVVRVTVADGKHEFAIRQTKAPAVRVNQEWTVDTVPPTRPTNLRLGATRGNTLALTWDAASDGTGCGITDHQVTYQVVGAAAPVNVRTNGSTTGFDLTGLPSTRVVRVTVAAIDGAGNTGAVSDEVEARVVSGGDGTLGAPASLNTPLVAPRRVLAGDFNGDHILDLAVLRDVPGGGMLSVFLGTGSNGRGDGGFVPRVEYSMPAAAVMASGDLDGDGKTDLVVGGAVGASGSLVVLQGLGAGQFVATQTLPFSLPVVCIALADLDADRILDLAVGAGEEKVTLFTGNTGSNGRPNATFSLLRNASLLNLLPQQIGFADLDDDNVPDLVVAGIGTSRPPTGLQVLRSAGGAPVSVSAEPNRDMVVTDLNGDGIADVATLSADGATLRVWLAGRTAGCATGTLVASGSYPTPVNATTLLVAQLDGDGVPDLLTVGASGVGVHRGGVNGRHSGLFTAAVAYPAGTGAAHGTVGDFDGNGALDLIVCSTDPADLRLLRGRGGLGRGDGTFLAAPVPYADNSRQPFALVAGDFNGDGILDLAASSQFGPNPQQEVVVLLGQGQGGIGNGTFAAPQFFPVGLVTQALAVTDLNRDHVLDLVAGNTGIVAPTPDPATQNLALLFGAGDGTFRTPIVQLPFGAPTRGLAVAELRRAGAPDLIAVSFYPSANARVYLGPTVQQCVTTPGYTPQPVFSAGAGSQAIVTADFDQDRIPDAAIAASSDNAVRIWLGVGSNGRGTGSLGTGATLTTGVFPIALASADFNGDHKSDLVVMNRGNTPAQGSIVVLRGDGGAFTETWRRTGAAYPFPRAVATGDFNGDGVVDFIVGSDPDNGGDYLRVFLGRGDGAFDEGFRYDLTNARGAFDMVVADFNSDGIQDVAFTTRESANGGKILLLLGQGSYP